MHCFTQKSQNSKYPRRQRALFYTKNNKTGNTVGASLKPPTTFFYKTENTLGASVHYFVIIGTKQEIPWATACTILYKKSQNRKYPGR